MEVEPPSPSLPSDSDSDSDCAMLGLPLERQCANRDLWGVAPTSSPASSPNPTKSYTNLPM